jgi:hypothetical protein
MAENVAPAVFRLYAKCPQCGKHCAPEELAGSQPRCYQCQEWHERAVNVLNASLGCYDCKKSWEQFRAEAGPAEVKMYIVPRDGIYQVLCRPCCDEFVRLSRALYAGTAFAEAMKL